MSYLLYALFILIIYYLLKRKIEILNFEKNGIPGPTPSLLFGNLFYMRHLTLLDRQKHLFEKFGKIVRYYSGRIKLVIVADPILVKKVLIENFNMFTDRPHVLMKMLSVNPKYNRIIIASLGNEWKQIRSILSPTFSPANLRTFQPLINETVDTFMTILDAFSENNIEFKIFAYFQRLVAEMTIKTSFGISTDIQYNHTNQVYTTGEKLMADTPNKFFLFILSCFPELTAILTFINKIQSYLFVKDDSSNLANYRSTFEELLKNEEKYENKRKNIYKLLLKASQLPEDSLEKFDYKIILNHEDILSNCMFFYGAGYETSSTTLAFTIHNLVNHQDVQDKVRDEIISVYKENCKLDYDSIPRLEYLEQVLNESMRMYPPVVKNVVRECLENFQYENMTIPKGTTIVIPTYYLHHDPDYWEEPDKFNPDRFSPENKNNIDPASFQPFSIGPRSCLGYRYAYLVLKITMAKLILNFKFVPGLNTEIGLADVKNRMFNISPKYGISVKVVKLKNNLIK